MPTPLVRARWLALALLAPLAGCGGHSEVQARLTAHQRAVDPPRLWLAESLGPAGAPTAAVMVCADSTLRAGFRRANAEADGEPCLPMKGGVEKPGLYAVRCQLRGQTFGLTLTSAGDPDRDFTTTLALTLLDGSGATTRQVRRYREVGPCPGGWAIGDQARPGERRRFNALAGTWG